MYINHNILRLIGEITLIRMLMMAHMTEHMMVRMMEAMKVRMTAVMMHQTITLIVEVVTQELADM